MIDHSRDRNDRSAGHDSSLHILGGTQTCVVRLLHLLGFTRSSLGEIAVCDDASRDPQSGSDSKECNRHIIRRWFRMNL